MQDPWYSSILEPGRRTTQLRISSAEGGETSVTFSASGCRRPWSPARFTSVALALPPSFLSQWVLSASQNYRRAPISSSALSPIPTLCPLLCMISSTPRPCLSPQGNDHHQTYQSAVLESDCVNLNLTSATYHVHDLRKVCILTYPFPHL